MIRLASTYTRQPRVFCVNHVVPPCLFFELVWQSVWLAVCCFLHPCATCSVPVSWLLYKPVDAENLWLKQVLRKHAHGAGTSVLVQVQLAVVYYIEALRICRRFSPVCNCSGKMGAETWWLCCSVAWCTCVLCLSVPVLLLRPGGCAALPCLSIREESTLPLRVIIST